MIRSSKSAILTKLAARYTIDRFVTENGPDPFRILIGCVVSLRTKDEVTYPATQRLFAKASRPAGMATITETIRRPQVRQTQCFIGGKWVPSASGKTFETIHPALEC